MGDGHDADNIDKSGQDSPEYQALLNLRSATFKFEFNSL